MSPLNDRDDNGLQEWLDSRKAAALEIDPETAELHWAYRHTMDPYGVDKNLPDECKQIGREWFARAPGSDIWVSFHDLPDAVVIALRRRPEGLAPLQLNTDAASMRAGLAESESPVDGEPGATSIGSNG
jgi:hypothetical protein